MRQTPRAQQPNEGRWALRLHSCMGMASSFNVFTLGEYVSVTDKSKFCASGLQIGNDGISEANYRRTTNHGLLGPLIADK